MAEKVAKVYNSLSLEQQKHTQIYTDNYGEASSLHLYGKQYHLPEAVCLNSSFSLWAPPNLNADYIIYVHEKDGANAKQFQPEIESYQQLSEIKNPLAIENGTGIFLIIHPKPALNMNYQKELAQKNLE